MLGSTSPTADPFARPRAAPEPPETSPPSSVRRPRARRRDEETSEPELVSPVERPRRGRAAQSSAGHLISSPAAAPAAPENGRFGSALSGGMLGFRASAPATGGFFSAMAPPPLASTAKGPAPVTFNFVTGEAKLVETVHTPVTPERRPAAPKNDSSDEVTHATQKVSSARSTRSRARTGSDAPEPQHQVLEGYKSAQKGTSVDPSSYDHVASEHGTGNAKAVRSPPDPFTSPRTDGEGSRSVSSRRGEKTSARVKARQNAVMKSRQISVPLSPGKASSPQRRQPSSDAFEEATPRPQRLRERDQPTPLSVEPMPPLQASSATKRMPFRELQPHEVPMSSTPTGISRHPAIDGSGKRQGAYRAGGPGSEAKQQRHHQQQPAAQQTQDVNRLYGQTCHLRDNLSSFLATLGLFRQDVLPYDLVRSQAIEADQVASAYSGTISNFANGPLGTHFGRFFSEISGFCLAMQPRLRTLVAGTMDAFSPGGIDAMASLDAVEKLAQFFQAKLSAFAGALEQAMSGGVTQQPQQGIRERYAPSPAGADQRRPYVDYIDPGVRSAQQPQAHTPRSALRAQAGIRSAGRSHPDAGTVDLLSPTSSVGSFCEDGEGSKRRRKSGPSSKKAPAYVHRTRVVVWRMDIDSKADPATIPPRIGTGHAMILHNNKVTWTSDEKAVDPVELVISECTVRRFNLPWQGPAEGEEVDEKDKNVVWITMGSNGGASSAQLVVDKENSALMTPANRKRPRSVAGTPQANVAKATEIKPATYLMRCFASADAAEFCKLLAQQGATLVE